MHRQTQKYATHGEYYSMLADQQILCEERMLGEY